MGIRGMEEIDIAKHKRPFLLTLLDRAFEKK